MEKDTNNMMNLTETMIVENSDVVQEIQDAVAAPSIVMSADEAMDWLRSL